MKKIAFLATFLLTSIVLAGAVGEISLRFVSGMGSSRTSANAVHYEQKDGYFTYPAKVLFEVPNEDHHSISVLTDRHGLRNPAQRFEKSDTWILGDSFIAWVNTPEDKTLASLLGAYNAGMDGFSTFQAISLLRALIKEKAPRQVILAFYLGNDFRDNLMTGGDEPVRVSASVARNLCSLSQLCQLLHQQLYLGVFKGQASNPMASYALAELAMLRQPPSKDALEARERTRKALADLAALGREKGFQVLVVGIPSKAQVMKSIHEISGFSDDPRAKERALDTISAGYSFDQPDTYLTELCDNLALKHVSLLTPFRQAKDQNIYYQIDSHWTANGQILASKEIKMALNHKP